MLEGRTQSLCPVCLRLVDAAYMRTGNTVSLHKTCPEHGAFCVPIWNEKEGMPRFGTWRQRARIPAYPTHPATEIQEGCPFDCGLCPEHAQHTCTGLIEVTQRCSLRCPVCFASAERTGSDPSLTTIAQQMDALFRASGTCNIQLSGGEPTEREDIVTIIAMAAERGFGLVQLNTNGMRLGKESGYAERLRQAGLDSVYLQLDALDDEVCLALRGRHCLKEKLAAVHACQKAGLGVVLVCTLVQGINDSLLGDLLRWAVEQGPHVRGLHIQPVSSFGRFPWDLKNAPRITLPDIMTSLEKQSAGMVHASDFHPPSCEHALCSFSAVYTRTQEGLSSPLGSSCCSGGSNMTSAAVDNAEGSRISRAFTATHWRAPSAHAQKENQPASAVQDAFSRFLAQSGAAQRFTLSAMAFQDAVTLDVERVRGCCIHVVARDGRLIPFCAYNLTSLEGVSLYRSQA
ncbi:MAG: radical SAM protein [Desulfovibrio sp.]|nr:radical SAM protein [Desulfovibrio sp.]